MIFYSIMPDGSRKYAAGADDPGFMRAWIEGRSGPPADALAAFDRAVGLLPKNVPAQMRTEFAQQYIAALTTMSAEGENQEQIAVDVDLVRKSALNLTRMIVDPARRQEFYGAITDAMGHVESGARAFGLDLRALTTMPAVPESDVETGARLEPEPGKPETPPKAGAPKEEAETPVDTLNRMHGVARSAAEQSVQQIGNELANFSQRALELMPLNQAEYGGFLDTFLEQLFGSMSQGVFTNYYESYGTGEGSDTSVARSVADDFRQIGLAFMFAMLDAASLQAAEVAQDDNDKQMMFKLSRKFDRNENAAWKRVAKQAEHVLGFARDAALTLANRQFPSEAAARKQRRRKSDRIPKLLYTKEGYISLYSQFIKFMKSLSPYAGWQSYISDHSSPGSIEDGALDNLEKVWNQAKIDAADDPQAADFVARFAPNRTLLFTANNMAKETMGVGNRSYAQDKNPERYINYLMETISSAAGGGGAAGSVQPQSIENRDVKPPGIRPPPKAQVPTGTGRILDMFTGGAGSTVFALGVAILAHYAEEAIRGGMDEERLQLNVPEERLQLNVPEEHLQLNVPGAPATPGGEAPQAPAVAGG